MKFSYSPNIANKLVFIDGLTRCGKSTLCQIIVSLKKLEHIDLCTPLESIMSGIILKKISPDYGKTFVRDYFNQSCYNRLISRGVNFRPTDFSGIQNFRNPKIYYDRLKIFSSGKKKYHYKKTHIKISSKEDIVLKSLKNKNFLFPYQSHLLLCDFEEFKKLDLNYLMLEIFRNPLDNVMSLINREQYKYNKKSDPRKFIYYIDYKNNSIPWNTFSYKNQYLKANYFERSALFVIKQIEKIKQKRKKISLLLGKKILFIKYENLIENTHKEIKRISTFLNTNQTTATKKFIKNADCPRKIDLNKNYFAKNFLRKKIKNKKIFRKLIQLEKSYKKNLYGFE